MARRTSEQRHTQPHDRGRAAATGRLISGDGGPATVLAICRADRAVTFHMLSTADPVVRLSDEVAYDFATNLLEVLDRAARHG